jgi:hypothetical protein
MRGLSIGIVVTVSKKPACRARLGGTVCQGRKGNNTVRRAFDSAGFANVAVASPRL